MEYLTFQGEQIPKLGFGTWQLRGREGKKAIKNALDIGYRLIDTAQSYNTEGVVGSALKESPIERKEVFITTKIRSSNLRYNNVIESVEDSLSRLNTNYVDLLLIHWPNERIPLKDTLKAMNRLQDEGEVIYIGVSNFTIELLKKARELAKTPIFANQVEYHPYLSQAAMLQYCQKHGIILNSYCPIARGEVLEDPLLKEIGETYGKTPVQVTLRWHIQQENVLTIPRSSRKKHIKENYQIFDFQLKDTEMQQINKLAKELRLVNPDSAPWR